MSAVDTEAVLHSSAATVLSRYAGFCDRADLLQEGRLWMWQHDGQVREKLADEEPAGRTASWLSTCLQRAMEVHARKCKAQVSGYDTEDESWYGRGVVALVLPKVLAGDREPPARDGLDDMPKASADPAETSHNWLVMWLDVQKAVTALDVDDRHYLWDRYHGELTFDDMAVKYGMANATSAQRVVRKAEDRVIEGLGGFKPRGCAPGCEHIEHDERLRRRPTGNEETW